MMTGRPTDYKPEYAKKALELCAAGATDAQLAESFEVSLRTILNWKGRHPEFLRALKVGKGNADDQVERSLFLKATGYTFDAVKIFNDDGVPLIVDYVEHIPPDTTAAIFWLKNRRPDEWREKVHSEVTGADGSPIVPIINITGRPEPSSAS